jgi:hypothetical protein
MRERQRNPRPQRLRRRSTDRVEDVVLWALVTLGLFTALVAGVTGMRLYGDGMHRVHVETRERTPLQAVLLEPAPYTVTAVDRVVRRVPTAVPVRYTAPDGTDRRAVVPVLGPHPPGATVPVWADRSGEITGAPARTVAAVARAATGAGAVLAVGGVVLGGIWLGVHAVALRLDMARWEQEWERVEPQWSGRTQR